jgi:pyruvate, water dikinase
VIASYVVALETVSMRDVARVGGKNASLGELLQHLGQAGVRAVGGFATDVSAYSAFLAANGLDRVIASAMADYAARRLPLDQVGKRVRDAVLAGSMPPDVADAIRASYRALAASRSERAPAVAVRSSATAEDLPEASFAGQQETFLNVRGEAALLDAVRACFASLYTDRAISYRENQGIDQVRVALSAGVQPMVRSDGAGAGVMFSVDTETGFPGVVVINASYGLGETVVQGSVDPDEYCVFKPLLEERGCRPILERKLGRKEQKLVYGRRGAATDLRATSRR